MRGGSSEPRLSVFFVVLVWTGKCQIIRRFRESDLLRRVFESVVQRCIDEGLVGGEGFAVHASLIQADANKRRSIPSDEWDPADLPPDALQAVKDYLSTLDDAAFGAASEVTPKFISPSDPAAQWTGALRAPAFFAYATNYLIDTDIALGLAGGKRQTGPLSWMSRRLVPSARLRSALPGP